MKSLSDGCPLHFNRGRSRLPQSVTPTTSLYQRLQDGSVMPLRPAHLVASLKSRDHGLSLRDLRDRGRAATRCPRTPTRQLIPIYLLEFSPSHCAGTSARHPGSRTRFTAHGSVSMWVLVMLPGSTISLRVILVPQMRHLGAPHPNFCFLRSFSSCSVAALLSRCCRRQATT